MSARNLAELAQTLLEQQAKTSRRVRALENKSDLGFSSIEDGRAIDEFATNGTLQASFGGQFDGSNVAVSFTGPTPPIPSYPTCVGEWATIQVSWDGYFMGADGQTDQMIVAPLDFSRVEVHASQDPNFSDAFADTLKGTIETPRGTPLSFFATPGVWYVRLVTRTAAGKRSDPQPGAAVVTSKALEAHQEFQSAVVARMTVYLTNDDGTGNVSEVNGKGIRVYNRDLVTGEIQERVRLGTHSEEEYIGLTNDADELTVSIDKDGNVVGRHVNATETFLYKGSELSTLLENLPRGLRAWASRTATSLYWAKAFQPYLHLRFTAEEGRAYMVQTSPIQTDGDTPEAEARVHLQYETSGGNASTSSQTIAEGIAPQGNFPTRRAAVTINRLITPPPGDVSLLISYSALDGRSKISVSPSRHVVLSVVDIGPAIAETGEDRNGSADAPTGTGVQDPQTDPTPPATVQRTTYEVGHSNVRSYIGSNAVYNYNPGKGYQGQSPAGYGNLKSIWTFPDVTARLAGATVHEIWAFFYFDTWYYGSGGTARIRGHNHLSVPSSYSDTGGGMDSGGWPRASGRWVKVPPEQYAGWKSGLYRGFALEGNGTYQTYGIASRSRLRIIYTK